MEPLISEDQISASTPSIMGDNARTPIATLFIDTDPLVLDAVELFFSRSNSIVVTPIGTFDDAHEQLKKGTYDVIVIDATFPQIEQLLIQQQATSLHPPVIATYILTEVQQLDRLPPGSVELALLKPLERSALERAIWHVYETACLRKQCQQLEHRIHEITEMTNRIAALEQNIHALSIQMEERDRRFRFAIHDLQNPLANLNALLRGLLQQPESLPTTVSHTLELCVQTTSLMQSLIEDLLSISQLNYRTPSYQQIDICTLLRSVARSFSAHAESKNIWINVIVQDVLPSVWGDEYLLRKALDNLISNAIKYTPYGGSVTLEATMTSELAIIRVRDTGVGLTPEDIEQAFQEFTRLSAKPTGGEPSTGLGLYIVRRIVEIHRGNVYIESKGKGQGSTVTLELPLHSRHGGVLPKS